MDKDWYKNKLVGNNAENIIEFLINSTPNWKCLKFGVENFTATIKDVVRNNHTPIAKKIRKMPDFFVLNEKTGDIFLIEVKSSSKRADGKYMFNLGLEDYKTYWGGTKLIIVSKKEPHFIYIDLEKVDDSMRETKKFNETSKALWNFGLIEKDIKDLFPGLKDESIKEAIKSLMLKEDN